MCPQRARLEMWILAWRQMSMPTCSAGMQTMYGIKRGTFARGNAKQIKKVRTCQLSEKWRCRFCDCGLASKPFVLQHHFGFPPFSSINSKYCKGCNSRTKEITTCSKGAWSFRDSSPLRCCKFRYVRSIPLRSSPDVCGVLTQTFLLMERILRHPDSHETTGVLRCISSPDLSQLRETSKQTHPLGQPLKFNENGPIYTSQKPPQKILLEL